MVVSGLPERTMRLSPPGAGQGRRPGPIGLGRAALGTDSLNEPVRVPSRPSPPRATRDQLGSP